MSTSLRPIHYQLVCIMCPTSFRCPFSLQPFQPQDRHDMLTVGIQVACTRTLWFDPQTARHAVVVIVFVALCDCAALSFPFSKTRGIQHFPPDMFVTPLVIVAINEQQLQQRNAFLEIESCLNRLPMGLQVCCSRWARSSGRRASSCVSHHSLNFLNEWPHNNSRSSSSFKAGCRWADAFLPDGH